MGSADGDNKTLDAVGGSEWHETSDSESTMKALEREYLRIREGAYDELHEPAKIN